MAKLSLDFEPNYDFKLYGIGCHIKNYKLIWGINNHLRLEFERSDDIELITKENLKIFFPVYTYFNNEFETSYNIISNRTSNGYLINEQKQVDYYLLINEPILEQESEKIIEGLKELKSVLILHEINPNDLKSKSNLLLT